MPALLLFRKSIVDKYQKRIVIVMLVRFNTALVLFSCVGYILGDKSVIGAEICLWTRMRKKILKLLLKANKASPGIDEKDLLDE